MPLHKISWLQTIMTIHYVILPIFWEGILHLKFLLLKVLFLKEVIMTFSFSLKDLINMIIPEGLQWE